MEALVHDDELLHGKKTRLSKYLPEFVYGGIDGIVTTFAVVAGATGANLDISVVLILGFANLFADGFSMSIGAYLAAKSEHQEYEKHKKIEEREIVQFREEEVQEIRDIYAEKGFQGELLEQVVTTITANDKVWVDTMMQEEHGLMAPDKSPFHIGLTTLLAFLAVGFVPLLTYVATYLFPEKNIALFELSLVLTAAAFIFIGRLKSYVTHSNIWKAILETVLLGGLAAGVAYYVGFVLEKIIVG